MFENEAATKAATPNHSEIIESNSDLDKRSQEKRSAGAILKNLQTHCTPENIFLYRQIFYGRQDVIAETWKSKRDGKNQWSPRCANKWDADKCNIKKKIRGGCKECEYFQAVPLTDDLVERLINGGKNSIIGMYALLQDNTCRVVAADFDKHKDSDPEPYDEVMRFVAVCEVQEIPCFVLRSKSGKGFHVYISFKSAVPAWKARAVVFALLGEAGIIGDDVELSSFDRLFPNQAKLSGKGYGNLIAMPFQGGAGMRGHTLILDPETEYKEPCLDQWQALRDIIDHGQASEEDLDRLIDEFDLNEEQPPKRSGAGKGPVQQQEYKAVFSRIKNGCKFIKHCCDDSETLPEPEWYVFLNIVGRCKDGRRQAHKYSENHPDYNHSDTESKLEHALTAVTGPYLCETIQGINGKFCGKCPNKGRITTPLRLGEHAENDDEYLEILNRLNKCHAVVMLGGKCQVMNETIDPALNRLDITFSSPTDFKNYYKNKKILDPNGKGDKMISLGEYWFEHPERAEYRGIVFDPSGTPDGYYNLWRGFAMSPIQGDWSLFRQHIWENIACRNEKIFLWLLAWFARIVQDPGGKRPGTSIVLRGKQGTGKGKLFDHLGEPIFGKHYLQIAQSKQVTGHFNSHLKDSLLVFVDEGFWAGDKQAEGVIKNMVTEPYINIEHKGKDIIRVKNNINLVIASNNDWVIPAGLEERRFFVLDVSDEHQQDHEYFAAIDRQMENGGREAMFYDLLHMDISDVNPRTFERTNGLFEQILNSMTTVQKYWYERLSEGTLRPEQYKEMAQYSDRGCASWGEIPTEDQYKDYLNFAEKLNDRYPLCEAQFALALKKLCPDFKRHRPRIGNSRISVRRFPPLDFCRAEFEEMVKMDIHWDEDQSDEIIF